jgi:CxxC motif-containing protein (DUF1111 family)
MKLKINFGLLLGMTLLACASSADELFPREAFSHPVAGLDTAALETFYRGRTEFLQSWAIPPEGGNVSALGPLFNRIACVSCHQKNGRGRSPDGPDERMLSMLVRLSVPGTGEHGSPRPHPAYGGQLNEEGAPGVPGEGRAAIHWQEKTLKLQDGTVIHLRSPRIEFVDMQYGSTKGMLFSPRIGQPVYGLGLLEAVPVATLESIAAQQKKAGIHGAFNRVWDVALKKEVPGRFGWKANSPTLRQQIAEAFVGDLGVTSPLFPEAQCAGTQRECRMAPLSKSSPELSDKRLDDIAFYTIHLAPPARRNTGDAQVQRGEKLFASAGCAACHVPQLVTATHPTYPTTLPAQTIAPYSDLLLHDMGADLTDNRPDFKASGRQWRTQPLWGVGLIPVVNEHSQYLHDGRARNLEEAVVWHGGEAKPARDRYTKLNKEQRQDLLSFLQTL